MKKSFDFKMLVSVVMILSLALFLTSCGSSNDGGGDLLPPAYNVNGTWDVEEYATNPMTCSGAAGAADFYNVLVTHDGTSNTITVLDTRPGSSSSTATISGNVISFSGSRYNINDYDCQSMTAVYSLTLTSGSSFSGTGTVYCHEWDGETCYVSSSLSGTKLY